MEIRDWERLLDRATADGFTAHDHLLVVYEHDGFAHSSQLCILDAYPRRVTPREALRTNRPSWCDCRGWEGHRFGEILRMFERYYRALDTERDQIVLTDWHLVAASVDKLRDRRQLFRVEDLELSTLDENTRSLMMRILERSRTHLDAEELARIVAAQAVTAAVTPADAPLLERWARNKRLGSSRRGTVGGVEERFETLLDARLAAPGRRLVAIRAAKPATGDVVARAASTPRPLAHIHVHRPPDKTTGRHRRVDANTGAGDEDLAPTADGPAPGTAALPDEALPVEVALYLWAGGVTTERTLLLSVDEALADGIRAMTGGGTRVSVATDDEADPEILETVRVLCDEHPGDRVVDLDEILVTARLV